MSVLLDSIITGEFKGKRLYNTSLGDILLSALQLINTNTKGEPETTGGRVVRLHYMGDESGKKLSFTQIKDFG